MYIINSHNEAVAEENEVIEAEIEVNIEEVEPQDIVVESFEFGYQFDLETDYFTSNVYCSEENNYYLDHDSEGRENPYGEVYFNKNEYDNGFFILYGHNMNDGSMFGPEGVGFMRMNLGCPRSVLEKALMALKSAVDSIS